MTAARSLTVNGRRVLESNPAMPWPRLAAVSFGGVREAAGDVPYAMSGTGAPEHTAPPGSLYFRRDGAADTTLYAMVATTWTAIEGAGGSSTLTDLVVTGNTTLGNAGTDTLSITARLITDLLPLANNLRDLGSTALRFKDGWFQGAVTAVGGFLGPATGALNGTLGATTPAAAAVTTLTSTSEVVDGFPLLGAHSTRVQYDSGLVSLDTGDASTAITMNIPAGALVIGAALKVTTEIAGIDSTTGTLALTGGSTATLGTISAFTAGTLGTFAAAAPTTATTQASFVLSGGGDDIPSAGAVRLVITAIVQAALD